MCSRPLTCIIREKALTSHYIYSHERSYNGWLALGLPYPLISLILSTSFWFDKSSVGSRLWSLFSHNMTNTAFVYLVAPTDQRSRNHASWLATFLKHLAFKAHRRFLYVGANLCPLRKTIAYVMPAW